MANSNWIENNDFLSNRFLIASWYNPVMSQAVTAMHRWCQIERLSDWKCWHGRLKIHAKNICFTVCFLHFTSYPELSDFVFSSVFSLDNVTKAAWFVGGVWFGLVLCGEVLCVSLLFVLGFVSLVGLCFFFSLFFPPPLARRKHTSCISKAKNLLST